ncbi:dromyosuppressin [Drosophila innubila]|uniref:dromyosuppressin n=1 Tax=Drosophila innubila TaxID=198719 RepID=UPI00148DA167|nr:dromyosuppressin [Drosophila innubila]XP_034485718.1 dromyosuppressin [Drosophila innubila]
MSQMLFFVVCCFAIILLAVCVPSTQASAEPICQPGILDEMPQNIRKVCSALESNDQLSTFLKSYINNQASTLVANSEDLLKNYNKRTDVDHVFLRFGKRR